MPNPFAKLKTFHKMGNLTVAPVVRLFPAPTGLGIVTVTGRKSGKAYTRPMRVVRDGDRAYAQALLGERADWVHNVRANPRVLIKLGGTTYNATAHEIAGADERARARAIYHPVVGWYDYFDYVTYLWGIPTKSTLLRQHDEWFDEGTPVVFELETAPR